MYCEPILLSPMSSRFSPKIIIFVVLYSTLMREIQMVDLKAQYEKIGAEVDAAIKSVLSYFAFIKGPDVRHFEESLSNYLGVRNVVSCANGTDALQIAMMALHMKPGDEVITKNFTFIETVEVVALIGLKPVLAEPDLNTYNISVESIRRAITPRTKACLLYTSDAADEEDS